MVRPPDFPPVDPHASEDGGRRRWPRRVGLVAAGAVLLALISGATWIARYQPIQAGSSGYAPPKGIGATSNPVTWEGADIPPGATVFTIPATRDMSFRYLFSITNAGPVSITIHGIGLPGSEQAGDLVVRFPVRVQENRYEPGPLGSAWIPFRSFTLHPGQEATIEMQATLLGCIQKSTSVSWGDEEVTYSVFGITRHATFTPAVQIQLVGSDASCLG